VKKILELYGLTSIQEWNDNHRFDSDISERIKSISAYLEAKIASKDEAEALFYIILGRYDGSYRAGRSFISILHELINSDEYKLNMCSFTLEKYKIINQLHTVNFRKFNVYLDLCSQASHGQATFSCALRVLPDGVIAKFPINATSDVIAFRFFPILPIVELFLEKYHREEMVGKEAELFFADLTVRDKCISFCSNKNDYLIPDDYFMRAHGYDNFRVYNMLSWEIKKPLAYFRGRDTGIDYYKSIANTQRFKLALLSKEFSNYIDVAITAAQYGKNVEDHYKELGIFGASEPQEMVFEYKYQIDVDGVSNSWPGLFIKLLSGGVVLKVDSPEGFRQWYYNKLDPWINYVPVKADLSDLVKIIEYLQKNDAHAREIGKNGRDLALSIDYKSSVEYGGLVLNNALIGV
jgi:hypothetical protein